jgi:hypothetical protein
VGEHDSSFDRNGFPLFFPLSSRPERFDLNGSSFSGGVVMKPRPWPIFRPLHKSTPDRIAVHIPKLLQKLSSAKTKKVRKWNEPDFW